MRVRAVYTLKSFAELKDALEYAKSIKAGAGSHADAELEIEFDKKSKKLGSLGGKGLTAILPTSPPEEEESALPWKVVVVNEDPVPGGSPCAECDQPHFEEDFLCSDCRAAA
jgi:hypothetical protein